MPATSVIWRSASASPGQPHRQQTEADVALPGQNRTRAALTPRRTGADCARTDPRVGVSRPAMTRRRVDLPEPFLPMT